ncbi:MAG: class I SAM-dependent methyltransferase [Deltaproteobacteria bacterium]|nr:class I SAM-dependent methyltransferase [Deltaproteobacteria bacterium]
MEDIRRAYQAVRDHVETRRLISRYSVNRQDIRESALEGLDMSAFERVLDLGCAYGFFTEKLAGRLKEGAAVTGLDLIDDANRTLFLRTVDSMGYRGRFVAGSAELIGGMAEGSLDLVVASYSLYFFPHLIGRIARILRPGGIFIAITHAESSLREVIRLIPGCMASAGIDSPPAEPAIGRLLRAFSLENGEAQLRDHFGRIERIIFENDLSFPLDSIEDCADYLGKKRALLFKELFDEHPQRADEALSCFYRELRENASREGHVVITKDDCIFRCFDPVG